MRILLADDHAITRDGLRAILEKEPTLTIVGEAPNGRDALVLAAKLRPDVVVMDVSMPDLGGVEATRQLVAQQPGIHVVALSMHSDRRYVLAMLSAGASAYLLKDGAASDLVAALHAVARGGTCVSPAIAGVVVDCVRNGVRGLPAREVSAREREVLQLLAEGRSSKEIAARLSIALPTVETHRRQIMAKLGIRSVAGLTKYAIREGLTPL